MINICFNLSQKLQGGMCKFFNFFANIKNLSYSSPLHQKRQPMKEKNQCHVQTQQLACCYDITS